MKTGQPWTADEDAIILREHVPGHPEWERIGTLLDRTAKAVNSRYMKHLRYQSGDRQDQPAAGVTIPCMCCRAAFASWDRVRNRLCANCSSRSNLPYNPVYLKHGVV